MAKLRWQDVASLALGIWIALSPWILGFAEELPPATWNALILGAIIVMLAAVDLDTPARWEAAASIVLGAWAVVSPVALGFAANREATLCMFAAGVAIVVLGSWTLVSARREQRRDETVHDH